MWDGQPGPIKTAKHQMELASIDIRSVHSVAYCTGPIARQSAANMIQTMLQEEVIKPGNTEWARPIVFAPKKGGSMRSCVDYHDLNAVIVKDSYAFPGIHECINSFGKSRIFSTIYARSGYW